MVVRRRTIRVDQLARVEGEGALHLVTDGRRVLEARLEIYEPPRFFEAFLVGRDWHEVVDIVARICGICPVAYQMSAVHALEQIAGLRVGGGLRQLRRLLYCGEWIESHTLHVYMLHAPDFLGYESAIDMAADHRAAVERGLRLKKAGNRILEVLGGRAVHPVNVRIGGFHRLPAREEFAALVPLLEQAVEDAAATVRWVAGFDFPDLVRDCVFVALRHGGEYPMNEGRIVSTAGHDIAVEEFDAHFREFQVPHSNALHSELEGVGAYVVGPLARFALNADLLSPAARQLAHELDFAAPRRNPYESIVVRALEVLHAAEEALAIVRDFDPAGPAHLEVQPRAGTGLGCTEAPRGILWHRYETEADGTIGRARIVPPTSQNQASIEADVVAAAESALDLPTAQLRWRLEQTIRNHDPCISCATHFLKLTVERRGEDGR